MKKNSQSGFIIICLIAILFFFCQKNENIAEETYKNSIIKVGVYNNPPNLFINNNSNPKGIFIDILEYISKKENLNIEYIQGDWHSLLNMLEKGEIDILPDIIYTKERDSIFNLNELPVLTSWLEVYTTERIEVKSAIDLNNKKIGVIKNSIEEEYLENSLKTRFNLCAETIKLPNYKDIINMLKNKKIDVFIAERFFRFYKEFDKEIIPSGVSFMPVNIHFGFTRNPNNDYLVNLFDKNISQLKNDPRSAYFSSLNHWLGEYFEHYTPPYLLWTIKIIIIVLIITSLFIIILKFQLKKRTKSLQLSNESLIKATEAAQKSDKLKTIFLQNISHEIRTPMNGILGFIDLLEEPDLDADTRNEYIRIVTRSGKRLMNTINEVIEISKIESGIQEIKNTEVNIDELLKERIIFFKPQANKKGLVLQLSEVLTGENTFIQTDSYKLVGILNNLLNNAIKFTEIGSIELGNYRHEDTLVFYVRDTGIGIPEDRIEAIFERFIQAEDKLTREHEGVGLGLAIVKGYVEALEGKIWVKSEKGKGSTFFFSIPYLPVVKGHYNSSHISN